MVNCAVNFGFGILLTVHVATFQRSQSPGHVEDCHSLPQKATCATERFILSLHWCYAFYISKPLCVVLIPPLSLCSSY